MFSYDPSNRILKVQKLAEEEVDLGLLEYQKESYQKYLTETIYSDIVVPRNEWTEFFFSLKNGFVSPNCPAQFVYFAKLLYEKYRICNLIGPMLPKEVKFYVSKSGYFGAGYTARDAICNFVNSHYQPITDERLIVRCGDWYEAYIPFTDMVAALPLEIGKLLTEEDLRKIRFTPGLGLTLEGRAISTFAGFQGVTNSFYDLRGVV